MALMYDMTSNNRRIKAFPLLLLLLSAIVALSLWRYNPWAGEDNSKTREPLPWIQAIPVPEYALSSDELKTMLASSSLHLLRDHEFTLKRHDSSLRITTSLDIDLQKYLASLLRTRWAQYIGVVAMDPNTGRILAMVGYDKYHSGANPCIDILYPAASVFKIVTTVAAVEQFNLNASAPLYYNGRPHTLYRFQLRKRRNRWTRKISLADAFAKSINPVFGKLGVQKLKYQLLNEYGEKLGFNRQIPFDAPVATSHLSIRKDATYNYAEIASGFNRKTAISTLHAALLGELATGKGTLTVPWIISTIHDSQGNLRYKHTPTKPTPVISPRASAVLNTCMRRTIRAGTSRKTFRRAKRDPVLKRLNIGGKTGSIYNRTHVVKYDWFVGFAEEKEGLRKLVVAAVVAHYRYLDRRAAYYARQTMKKYFEHQFAGELPLLAQSEKTQKENKN